MSLVVRDHFQACSVAALDGVSRLSPKDCLLAYIKSLSHTYLNSADKKYKQGYRFGYYVHVFFVGPDMRTMKAADGKLLDHHYSGVGSCNELAAYIRENNLGPVTESEPRWNHRHASTRKPGQGDLIAYVWSPDPDALAKWFDDNKPPKPEVTA